MRCSAAAILAVLVLCGGGGAWAQSKAPAATPKPAQPAQPQPAQIDRNGVLILVRGSMLALHQANITGNYTVLRDLGAPGFQSANTAARLAEIFASQRAQKLDLSGIATLEPQLTQLPQITPNGLMHMAGFFPSVPLQVNFELLYAPVQGQWRLMGISVNLGQSGPVAPEVSAADPKNPPAPAEPAKPAATPSSSSGSKPKPARRRSPRQPKAGTDQSPGDTSQ